jgi:phospholipid-binding lipoprotein MlaA
VRRARGIAAGLLLCALCACASTQPEAGDGPRPERDPVQPVNRGIFWFNNGLDRVLFEPLAIGWMFIFPDVVPTHIGKFFDHLEFPVRFLNNLFQGQWKQTGRELGRFVVNTTVGLAGFFDPATGWGLAKQDEDFGQTLGWWGLSSGPYLMLPLFGPSSPRDAVGLIVDAPLRAGPWFLTPVRLINTRGLLLDDIRQLRAASLDYYVAVRNAYTQLRRAQVANGELPKEEPEEDLYEVIDDEE